MIAIIDNYDSFTYNIRDAICQLTDTDVKVFRNDAISVSDLAALDPHSIVISPGPGNPDEAGISLDVIRYFAGKLPLLGICLGHQSIGQAFGGTIVRAKRVVHGKVDGIRHDGKGLFRGLSQPSRFTRYHSLAVEEANLPPCLEISARSEDGEIMGLRHRNFPVEGVQFHPESIGSDEGLRLLKNFLHYKKEAFDKKSMLERVMAGISLSRKEAAEFFDELTEGNLSEAYIAAMLSAIGTRGASEQEISGCVEVLHRKKTKVAVSVPVLDTCGTGGDGLQTFNISSLAAVTAAACGATVAKHGNRAVSSTSGCADYYRALGLDYDMTPERASEMIEADGFAFLFAPQYHKAMCFAAPARKEMGVKTLMNLVGPLANPAEAQYQLIGVYEDRLCPVMARAAKLLGAKRVMTAHASDGQDEFSVSSPTRFFLIDEYGNEVDGIFDPASIGIKGYKLSDVLGGGAEENAAMTEKIFSGMANPALIHAVALNAGAGLFVYGTALSIEKGYRMALLALSDGSAERKLATIIASSKASKTVKRTMA